MGIFFLLLSIGVIGRPHIPGLPEVPIGGPVSRQSACSNAAGKTAAADSGYGQIVKCSIRDSAGRLWFGTTWQGLFCYDGIKFIHYTIKNGLPSNQVNSLCQDATGLIWLGTNRGVCYFDGKGFNPFSLTTGSKSPGYFPAPATADNAGQSIECIVQDKAGNLWFGVWGGPGNAGAYRYDGKTITHFMPERPVQGIVQDDQGGIWLNSKRFNGGAFTDFPAKKMHSKTR